VTPISSLDLEAVLLQEPPDSVRGVDVDLASLVVSLQHASALVELVPEVHGHQPFIGSGPMEAEADDGPPIIEGFPLDEPATVGLQLGNVGEVKGIYAAGGDVPPDAPQGGDLVLSGEEVIEAEAGEVDEAESIPEVEVPGIRQLQVDAFADLGWLTGEVRLRSPEHVGRVVYAPGLDAGSGELDG